MNRGWSALRFQAAWVMGLFSVLVVAPATADSIWRSEEWIDVAGHGWIADELEGQVVLLDFWATWCAPCLAEMPRLRELHEEHSEHGLLIFGIVLDAIDRRGLRSFLLRHDVRWPQVHEPDGVLSDVAQRFGVEAVPVTVLVDRRGRVVARDLRGEALTKVIGTLISIAEPRRNQPRRVKFPDRPLP